MAKAKTIYYCQECGSQSPKWMGKCSQCHAWNSYVEEVISKPDATKDRWRDEKGGLAVTPGGGSSKPQLLKEIAYKKQIRLDTHDEELNRVLGGGLVPGSAVLLGGEPGIGKSTLLLQCALQMPYKILYVSGEESPQQIKMRADRMNIQNTNCFILNEANLDQIFSQISQMKPDVVVVDSIQTMQSSELDSAMGTVSQVRECTNELIRFAKETSTPVILVGHVTKDGTLAGPKVMEHMVDTVLHFEGDRHLSYRLLRTVKNRFGSTAELGIYEMQNTGLRQVTNPSEILISQREEDTSGVAIAAMLEGNRPLLIEIQALVSPATYGTPQRSSTGYDAKRLNMLLAVLEKRGGFRLGTQDVFLNVAGGLRVEDPAVDLAVCAAIVSSYQDVSIPANVCFAGEVGLSGEVRAVNRLENRLTEAAKLGFREMFVSKFGTKDLDTKKSDMTIRMAGKISEVFTRILS